MTRTTQQTKGSLVSGLRALMPRRSIQVHEAYRVAELQAARVRMHFGDSSPFFDTAAFSKLPRITVMEDSKLQASGVTEWSAGSWQISIRSDEAEVRQRFTLAHEMKHVLDAPQLASAYKEVRSRSDANRQMEAICDYFAACLLMPKRWVKRLWGEGVHDLAALANAFDVSQVAMRRRLEEIGLIERRQRIAPRHAVRYPAGPSGMTFRRNQPTAAVHLLEAT